MKQKIKSITEAFSMQPNIHSITFEHQVNINDEKTRQFIIKEINLERTEMLINGSYVQYEVYRGYNWNGDKLFEYLANSVNVHYYYE